MKVAGMIFNCTGCNEGLVSDAIFCHRCGKRTELDTAVRESGNAGQDAITPNRKSTRRMSRQDSTAVSETNDTETTKQPATAGFILRHRGLDVDDDDVSSDDTNSSSSLQERAKRLRMSLKTRPSVDNAVAPALLTECPASASAKPLLKQRQRAPISIPQLTPQRRLYMCGLQPTKIEPSSSSSTSSSSSPSSSSTRASSESETMAAEPEKNEFNGTHFNLIQIPIRCADDPYLAPNLTGTDCNINDVFSKPDVEDKKHHQRRDYAASSSGMTKPAFMQSWHYTDNAQLSQSMLNKLRTVNKIVLYQSLGSGFRSDDKTLIHLDYSCRNNNEAGRNDYREGYEKVHSFPEDASHGCSNEPCNRYQRAEAIPEQKRREKKCGDIVGTRLKGHSSSRMRHRSECEPGAQRGNGHPYNDEYIDEERREATFRGHGRSRRTSWSQYTDDVRSRRRKTRSVFTEYDNTSNHTTVDTDTHFVVQQQRNDQPTNEGQARRGKSQAGSRRNRVAKNGQRHQRQKRLNPQRRQQRQQQSRPGRQQRQRDQQQQQQRETRKEQHERSTRQDRQMRSGSRQPGVQTAIPKSKLGEGSNQKATKTGLVSRPRDYHGIPIITASVDRVHSAYDSMPRVPACDAPKTPTRRVFTDSSADDED